MRVHRARDTQAATIRTPIDRARACANAFAARGRAQDASLSSGTVQQCALMPSPLVGEGWERGPEQRSGPAPSQLRLGSKLPSLRISPARGERFGAAKEWLPERQHLEAGPAKQQPEERAAPAPHSPLGKKNSRRCSPMRAGRRVSASMQHHEDCTSASTSSPRLISVE